MLNILLNSKSNLKEESFFQVLKNYLHPGFKVCVFLFSFFTKSNDEYDDDFFRDMKDNFRLYGILEEDISFIDFYDWTPQEAIEELQAAQIIFLPGGSPTQLYERLKEFKLVDPQLYQNKIIIGSSAGAMVQLDYYHISVDRDYDHYQEHQGLGLIKNFKIEVHYKAKFSTWIAIRRSYKKFHKPILLMANGSGIVVDNQRLTYINKIKKYNPKKYEL
ncbi:MAG: Type 1 glutamine amidotransferase-like domain-containing protein [Acholeplasmatales bacterium]|jgi:peptidase E|nr:Type 1 glutamine amidotransferase-like domain-containing protein [Acholeplasmatales bacterium]